MNKYALLIGVNRYNWLEPGLKGAEADAVDLARFLAEQLGFETELLTDSDLGYDNQNGSHERIEDRLREIGEKLQEAGGGKLLLYFAGHGITTAQGEQLLLGPKAGKDALSNPKLGASGVFSEGLLRDKTEWPGVERAFVFDACRTSDNRPPPARGGVTGRAPGPGFPPPEYPEDLVVVRSCPPDAIASELTNYGEDGQNHGLFSAALLSVFRRQAEDELPLELGPELGLKLAQEMQRLARQHIKDADPVRKARALAQQPEIHGGGFQLAERSDYRQQKIVRLTASFENQLEKGNLSEPPGLSCRSILNELRSLIRDSGKLKVLSDRLHAAEEDKKRETARGQEKRLIETARRLSTIESYAKYLEECRLCEFAEEAERFIRDAQIHADLADWDETRQQPNQLSACRRYLSRHAQGLHAAEARQIIEELEWGVLDRGSSGALEDFCRRWPDGLHRAEADRLIADLAAAVEKDDEALYQNCVDDPDGLAAAEWQTDQYRQRAADRLAKLRVLTAQKEQEEADREEALWSGCHEADSEEGYRHYLDQSRLQRYRDGAERLLAAKIADREAKEADQALWEKVGNDLAELEAAKKHWQTDQYRQRALDRLAELRTAMAEEEQKEIEREESFWRECREADSEEGYRRYLDDSRLGRYRDEAERLLAATIADREAKEADCALWERVSDDLAGLEASEKQWQTDEYRRGALDRLAKLRTAMAEEERKEIEREEALWRECREADSGEGYRRYLNESQLFRYRQEADKRLAAIIAAKLEEDKKTDLALWGKVGGDLAGLEAAENQWRTDEFRKRASGKLNELREDADRLLWNRIGDNLADLLAATDWWRTKDYRQKAQKKITQLREEETKKKRDEDSDRLLWGKVADDLALLKAATGKWRTEDFRQRAKLRLSELQATREKGLWNTCRATNTVASYRRYLKESEPLLHKQEASTLLAARLQVARKGARKILIVAGLALLAVVLVIFLSRRGSYTPDSTGPADVASRQLTVEEIRQGLETEGEWSAEVKTWLQSHGDQPELADPLVGFYTGILTGEFRSEEAGRRRQAWLILNSLSSGGYQRLSSLAADGLAAFKKETDLLDSAVNGLRNRPDLQAGEKRWPDYEFRLTLLADHGDISAAWALGQIFTGQGKIVPAFRRLYQAAEADDVTDPDALKAKQNAVRNLPIFLERVTGSGTRAQLNELLDELLRLGGARNKQIAIAMVTCIDELKKLRM